MLKSNGDWHQTCKSCGVQLVVHQLEYCPSEECSCPWCGASIEVPAGIESHIQQPISDAVNNLSGQVNAEIG